MNDYGFPQAKSVKRRRWRKRLIILVIVLLVVGIIVAVVRNLNAPAEGSIAQAPPSKQEVVDPYSQPGTYSGKYVSFTYPAHYKKAASQLSGTYLEVVELSSTQSDGRHITVGVLKQELSSYTGYNYRLQHPELYRKEPTTQFGHTFTSLGTANGSEITAFTNQHGDKIATVSVTGSGVQDLTSDCTTVLDSLTFKQ